jgi:hypothetical protein
MEEPRKGVVTINWDAALDKLKQNMGVGRRVIAKDVERFVLATNFAEIWGFNE